MRALVGHIAQNRNLPANRIRYGDDSLYPIAEIYFNNPRRARHMLTGCMFQLTSG
jgi:hypothetical protein